MDRRRMEEKSVTEKGKAGEDEKEKGTEGEDEK